jgi:hypothetical protein
MIMMPYGWAWSSLQLAGQANFWHPTGCRRPAFSCGALPDVVGKVLRIDDGQPPVIGSRLPVV